MRRTHLVPITGGVCLLVSTLAAAQTIAPEGWVVLPIEEYRQLRDRANPPPPRPPGPPLDATLTRIDYDLRVGADGVTGRATLTIDVLRDGWTRLQIPSGLMVREATLDGLRVALVNTPAPHVLLSRAGRSILTLDIAVPLTSSAGAESIALPQSPSPITRVVLTLPKSGIDVSLNGGFIADRAETANESRWTAFGRPAQAMALTWKRKVDDRRAEQPLRVRATITEVVALGEEACQVTAAVRVDVVSGLARDVFLTTPPGLIVNQVNGATVADWESVGSRLRVTLLEPTAADVSFVVSGDAKTPRDGSIAVPLLRMPAAERETGGVAVDVAGAGETSGRETRGFEPADPSELGDLVSGRESPSMIAFRRLPLAGTEARSLTVGVVRYVPQAVAIANVEEARYRLLASDDGRLLVEARYAIRNNQRSFLKATLPEGSIVWSAQVGGRPIRPGVAGGNAILLPLEKSRPGDTAPTGSVELVYFQSIDAWADKQHARLDLPALDLPVSRTGVELHHSPRFRVEVQPGSFRLDTDPGPFAPILRAAATPPPPPPPPASPAPTGSADLRAGELQALANRYKNEGSRRVAGALPVRVTFPSVGPSLFLASELTAESQMPSVELLVRRMK